MEIDHSVEATKARMQVRRDALLSALPDDFKAREDGLPARIRGENASLQTKLGRIYALVDEYSALRAPYVACREGCADCCRMNVQISSIEAARIERATGRKARALTRSLRYDDGKFAGVACPFLKEDACSIYEQRPFVCRNHASLDVDAHWCDPQRMATVKLPLVELGGVKQAMLEVMVQSKQPVLADIRDFFPIT
ncbi:Fe-S-cluster containining protein [Variovorax sp. HW608]|uniref:YkgJ family cysteine cluster protein n=1 Tax=Variovorax sp. HW608 TaxID=1034889 RepID=UPI00082023CF|nr:YkgJ family cysteine cluster protein [Variovorax sp. HW608]SCK09008.1 Fe-S-cluster containining protein [Variovorax sp. HW608]